MSLLLQLKRHDRFSNFHVIVRKKLAFVLKLYSFGLSLRMLEDALKYQNSKFGHSMTVPGTMVTKYPDIHGSNLYAPWRVWCAVCGRAPGRARRGVQAGSSNISDRGMTCWGQWSFLLSSPSPTTDLYGLHCSFGDWSVYWSWMFIWVLLINQQIQSRRRESGLSSPVTISISGLLWQQVFEV